VDVYRRPGDEFLGDALVGGEVRVAKGADGAVREDDAPAVGGSRRVAFDDVNIVVGVGFFEEDGGVEAAGAAAEDESFHLGYEKNRSYSLCFPIQNQVAVSPDNFPTAR
jgi:hypothetical protein